MYLWVWSDVGYGLMCCRYGVVDSHESQHGSPNNLLFHHALRHCWTEDVLQKIRSFESVKERNGGGRVKAQGLAVDVAAVLDFIAEIQGDRLVL